MVKILDRKQIAWRAAQDLQDGMYVNLGMGMPVMAANYAPGDREIMFQSENGIVGVGPLATPEQSDPDLVDAGSQRITLVDGACVVSSSEAFAMIRGGHIDVTLLGGFEVAPNGDMANWDSEIPNKGRLVGGAMDLATGARSVRVLMAHVTKHGAPRLVERCALPLTGVGVVDRVYTDLAVVDVTADGFLVREMVEGLSREQLQDRSGAPLRFAEDLKTLSVPAL